MTTKSSNEELEDKAPEEEEAPPVMPSSFDPEEDKSREKLKNLWNNLSNERKMEVIQRKRSQIAKDQEQEAQCEKELKEITKYLSQHDLDVIVPTQKVLTKEEKLPYYKIINMFIRGFEGHELLPFDIDDIVQLALNRVLENRLLESGKNSPKDMLDISNSIERIHKHSERLRQNLASRRTDRLDPKDRPTFSIVDLAAAYDAKRKAELDERARKIEEENNDFLERQRQRLEKGE